ncbi:MAG: Ig-like domain-containing protein, partial [Pirellulaceae bacterium]
SGTGLLDAWVDFNHNGVFTDAGEQIFTGVAVFAGENVLYASTPGTALLGTTYARFRLNSTTALGPDGLALGGEVEDLVVEVVPGDPPVSVSDSYALDEDTLLSVDAANGLLSNDMDSDSLPSELTVSLVQDVQHGSLILMADGSFEYVPDADFNGTDTFIYRTRDARLASDEPATVTLTVRSVNDLPIPGLVSRTSVEDVVLTIDGSDVLAAAKPGPDTATDELGQQLSLGLPIVLGVPQTTTTNGGTIALVNNQFVYTPPADFNRNFASAPDTFVYTITDNGFSNGVSAPRTATGTVTVTLTEVNDAPVPGIDFLNATEDQALTVAASFLTANDLAGPATATDETALPAMGGQTISLGIVGVQPRARRHCSIERKWQCGLYTAREFLGNGRLYIHTDGQRTNQWICVSPFRGRNRHGDGCQRERCARGES